MVVLFLVHVLRLSPIDGWNGVVCLPWAVRLFVATMTGVATTRTLSGIAAEELLGAGLEKLLSPAQLEEVKGP